MTVLVVTHPGGFHLDEVVGTAVVSMWTAIKGYGFDLRRTAEPDKLAQADILIAIGGCYQIERGRHLLDHHQPGGAGCRPNGVPYTVAGLAWKHFGKELLWAHLPPDLDDELVNLALYRIDERYMMPIDAEEIGGEWCQPIPAVSPFTLNRFVQLLNPPETAPPSEFDTAFNFAVQTIGKTLIVKARREITRELAELASKVAQS